MPYENGLGGPRSTFLDDDDDDDDDADDDADDDDDDGGDDDDGMTDSDMTDSDLRRQKIFISFITPRLVLPCEVESAKYPTPEG